MLYRKHVETWNKTHVISPDMIVCLLFYCYDLSLEDFMETFLFIKTLSDSNLWSK